MSQLPPNHWDEELKEINRIYKEHDTVYIDHLRSFQLIFTKVQTILGNIEPSITLYRKPQHVGSIHHSSQSRTPFKLNIYAYVEITENLTSVDFEEYAGHVRMMGDVNKKWLNNDKYLNQEKFYSWMESAIQRTLTRLSQTYPNVSVLRKKSPGLLFSITEYNKEELNINIIPAVVFNHIKGECFAIVDRNYFRYRQLQIQTMNPVPSDSWRVAFPKEEQRILHKNEHLKVTMRYIKLIRDTYELNYITNYCIKMMFLLKHKEEDNGFWNSSLTNLLIDMVDYFYECISERRLCDIWDMSYNILNEFEITSTQASDCCNRLKNIIRRINDRYDHIESILSNTSSYGTCAHRSRQIENHMTTVSPITRYVHPTMSISSTVRSLGRDGCYDYGDEDNVCEIYDDDEIPSWPRSSSMMTSNQRNEEQSNTMNTMLVAGGIAVVAVGAAALLGSIFARPNRNQN